MNRLAWVILPMSTVLNPVVVDAEIAWNVASSARCPKGAAWGSTVRTTSDPPAINTNDTTSASLVCVVSRGRPSRFAFRAVKP